MPKAAPYIVLAVALVLGAAILALIGFNAFGWAIVSGILFSAGLVGWSLGCGRRPQGQGQVGHLLVVGAFPIALLPLFSVI